MKTLTTNKQKERSEKKKKKLAALANLVQLNDKDRLHSSANKDNKNLESDDAEKNEINDGFTKVSNKKKSLRTKGIVPAPNETTKIDGPEAKRLKLVENGSCGDTLEDAGQVSDASGTSSTNDELLRSMKATLTDAEYKEVQRQLRERKRLSQNIPTLRLREFGNRALLQTPQEQRTPIFLTDIQNLLMASLLGKQSPCKPDRWCYLSKPVRLSHSVVLVLEGLSLYDYLSHETQFTNSNKIFDTRLELMLPPCKDGMIVEDIAQVPLTNVQSDQLIEKHGSLEMAMHMNTDPTLLVKAMFPIEPEMSETVAHSDTDLPAGDKFPRTTLLLSALQMVDDGYPIPLRGELNERFKNYVFTKEKYAPVSNRSPMFGVDCEMCRTSSGANELTRISIVNEQMETVYETLVMPSNKITDYLTRYSGITPEIMMTVTKRLAEVQREVQELLPPDAILVGQSLNFDLNAMKMMHPYVIDTSICFNITGQRGRKSKLQTLALTFLKESIQANMDGHDSVEDSLASLKLIKLKLANSMEYGDEILIQQKRLHEIYRSERKSRGIKNNLFAHVSQRDKRTAIVTAKALQPSLKAILKKADEAIATDSADLKSVALYELETNKAAIRKSREIALEHALTITNLQLNSEQLKLDVAAQTLTQLDKWIGKLWKSMAHNGMLLVLFGGSVESPSGVAKIAIKHNVADMIKEVPLHV